MYTTSIHIWIYVLGHIVGAATAVVLSGLMANRYKRTQKFMPAGVFGLQKEISISTFSQKQPHISIYHVAQLMSINIYVGYMYIYIYMYTLISV